MTKAEIEYILLRGCDDGESTTEEIVAKTLEVERYLKAQGVRQAAVWMRQDGPEGMRDADAMLRELLTEGVQ